MARTGGAETTPRYAALLGGAGDDELTHGPNSPGGGNKGGLARKFARRQVLFGAASGLVLAGASGVVSYECPRTRRATAAATKASSRTKPGEISRNLVEHG